MAERKTFMFVSKGITVFSLKLNAEAEGFGSSDALDNQRDSQ